MGLPELDQIIKAYANGSGMKISEISVCFAIPESTIRRNLIVSGVYNPRKYINEGKRLKVAIGLLTRFSLLHEGKLLPNDSIYSDVQEFLYGKQ